MATTFDTLVTGAFVENGYVLHEEGHDRAVVIDPGAEPERWVAWLAGKGLVPELVLGTHAHLDHVGAVSALQDAHGAAYRLHEDEVPMLEHLPVQCQMFGLPPIPVPRVSGHVADGETMDIAGVIIEAIATPGHTPGGMSYHVPALRAVFTGDTLFAGSIGRTDLPGGDHDQLLRSLGGLVERLPDDTAVCAGHGPTSTIGAERTGNPFFRVER